MTWGGGGWGLQEKLVTFARYRPLALLLALSSRTNSFAASLHSSIQDANASRNLRFDLLLTLYARPRWTVRGAR